mgnify:CR=1 FL=1
MGSSNRDCPFSERKRQIGIRWRKIKFIFNEIDKSEFEKVSEWDITIQDTMEEYDNVER